MFAVIIFWLSFAVILIMLSLKWFESKKGEVQWWANLISRGDERIHAFREAVIKKYLLWKKIVSLFLFEFLPAYLYRQAVKLKDYLYKKYYTSAGNLKGEKRMLRSSGTVSEFLQNISKEGEKQVEEETEQRKEEGLEKE